MGPSTSARNVTVFDTKSYGVNPPLSEPLESIFVVLQAFFRGGPPGYSTSRNFPAVFFGQQRALQ